MTPSTPRTPNAFFGLVLLVLALAATGTVLARGVADFGKLPLAFEPNRGQTDPRVAFLARGAGFQVFITPTEAVYRLQDAGEPSVIRMQLVGARASAQARGGDRLEGRSHYLAGADPAGWIRGVPQYARVELQRVYRGIDLAYYGNGAQLEYDFTVAPRADPGKIAIAVQGARELEVDGEGQLLVHTPAGVLAWHKPVAWQDSAGGRREVAAAYVLRGKQRFGIRVGTYDRSRPLVIDPVLAYSTLLGGTGHDHARAVAVDASGRAVITGQAASIDFPTTGAAVPAGGGVYVARLNAAGTALDYSTYLGPGRGTGIALHGGNAYVTGAGGATFPVTAGAYNDAQVGDNVFVAKLSPDGSSLVYSALFGGGLSQGAAIAVDAAGNAHVTGTTQSPAFPATAGAFQPTRPTDGQVFLGDIDAFYAKLNAAGSALLYATYLGSTENDFGEGIALDAAGRAYVAGTTTGRSAAWNGNPAAVSPFPTTAGAFQASFAGGASAFVTQFDSAAAGAASVVYSTVIGGDGEADQAHGIAVDGAGNAYVTGVAGPAFPRTSGAYGAAAASGAFVTQLDAAGSGLVYSAIVAGAQGRAIALDSAGNAFIAGLADAAAFTPVNPLPPSVGDAQFVTKLDASGANALYSTFIDGHADVRLGIAVDPFGAAYVAGTAFQYFLATPGAYQGTIAGGTDAFVTKIVTNQAPVASAGPDQTVLAGASFTLDAGASFDPDGDGLTYVWRDENGAVVGTASAISLTRGQGLHIFTVTISDGVNIASASVRVTVEAAVSINLFGTAPGRITSSDGKIDCATGNEPTCTARYASPTAVTLTASMAPGVVFTGWRPPCAGTGLCTVTVTSTVIVGAQFDVQQVTLSVVNAGGGRVTSTPAGIDCPGTCSMTVPYSTINPVGLAAGPDPGYLFGGWSDACSGTGSCSIFPDAAKTATASFTPIGPVSLSVAPASATIAVGGRAQLTATATFSDGSTRILTDRSLEASDNDTCAITRNGTVKCVGSRSSTPTRVAAFDQAIALAGGTSHMCALFANGAVNCEGTPVPLAGPAVAIAAQTVITCALLSSGSVQCWNGLSPAPTPVYVSGVVDAVAIGAEAGGGTCAVHAGGTVSCWGGLGDGSDPLLTPTPVAGVLNATAVTYGVNHGCALIADGTVMCWGENDHGQLGNGQVEPLPGVFTPATWVRDAAGVLTGAVSVVSGDYHACALLASGTAKCWGSGAALHSAADSPLALPFFSQVPPGLPAIPAARAVAAGAYLSCVTITDGTVWCMGLGPGFNFVGPTRVVGLDGVLAPVWTSGNAAVTSPASNGVTVGRGAGLTAVTVTEGSASAYTAITVTAGAGVTTRAVSADVAAPAVTVTFAGATQAGTTTVATLASCPAAPAGFQLGTPPTCLDVASTATFTPPATVCIAYDPGAFSGAPQLFHYEGGAWIDVTTSVDAVNHIVCGAVSAFSPFALMQPSVGGRLVADAGPDQELECTAPDGAAVTLDGSRSSRGPGVAYRWKGSFGSIEALVANVRLPLGNNVAHLEVADGRARAEDSVKIRVRDTQPPVIAAASAAPAVLPPGLGKVPVTVSLATTDLCDASVRCRIEKVRPLGGAGADDWEITGALTLRVSTARASRQGVRLYAIDVICTDDSGNRARTTVQVTVQ